MSKKEALEKLAAGQISVDEAARLLRGEGEPTASPSAESAESAPSTTEMLHPDPEEEPASARPPRWLKIRVGSGDRDTVRINIPLQLVNAGMMFGARWMGGEARKGAWAQAMEALKTGDTIIEVEDERDGDRVRIFVE